MAANTGEGRVITLEDTRIDNYVGCPSWLLRRKKKMPPAGSASSSESTFCGLPVVWAIMMNRVWTVQLNISRKGTQLQSMGDEVLKATLAWLSFPFLSFPFLAVLSVQSLALFGLALFDLERVRG